MSRSERSNANKSSGFSLLEVLVAMAIAALSLGIIMNLFAGSSRASMLNQNYQLALQLAESQLEAVTATPLQNLPSDQGKFDQYRWRSTVTPYQSAQPETIKSPFMLYQIQVEVSWGTREDYPVSLTTLRLGART